MRVFWECRDFFLRVVIFEPEQSSSYNSRRRRVGRRIFLLEINLNVKTNVKSIEIRLKSINFSYHDRVQIDIVDDESFYFETFASMSRLINGAHGDRFVRIQIFSQIFP